MHWLRNHPNSRNLNHNRSLSTGTLPSSTSASQHKQKKRPRTLSPTATVTTTLLVYNTATSTTTYTTTAATNTTTSAATDIAVIGGSMNARWCRGVDHQYDSQYDSHYHHHPSRPLTSLQNSPLLEPRSSDGTTDFRRRLDRFGGSRFVALLLVMLGMATQRPCVVVTAWSTKPTTTTTTTMVSSKRKLGKLRSMSYIHTNRRTFLPPPNWMGLRMSLDSRELRFYRRTTTASPAITTVTTTTDMATSTRHEYSSSSSTGSSRDVASHRDITSNNHHYQNSVIVPNYLSHIFPTSLLETQYKMMETITPVVVTAMSAVASAIMTTNLASATTGTTVPSQKVKERSPPFPRMEHTTALQVHQKRNDSAANSNRPKLTNTASIHRFNSTLASPVTAVGTQHLRRPRPPQSGYGPSIHLTTEEQELFNLLRHVRNEIGLTTTLRVAGGWVRDKLLATPEFQTYHRIFTVGSQAQQYQQSSVSASASLDPSKKLLQQQRISSKFRRNRNVFNSPRNPSIGRQGTKVLINKGNTNAADVYQPVDIDIALDDMLGREFADHLNEYLSKHGHDTVTVGMVLKNPDKSKHLETATMKVNTFWIDFVNLRAEEYTQDSRIPDLMRIGTPHEDAYRRDLTINSLFYNINTGQVEDWTGRGFQDLRKGVVATPLHPLTTLLDDPLRVLRSIRFAARLRFTMDDELVKAAQMSSVADALSQKVSRERVGGELDLMLRSPDPVGAIRLLMNLKQVQCVFPVAKYYKDSIIQQLTRKDVPTEQMDRAIAHAMGNVFRAGLLLLSTAHDHLADCLWSPPVWCINQKRIYDATEIRLVDDEDGRRLLWYASFLKPMYDEFKRITQNTESTVSTAPHASKRSSLKHRSIVMKMLVDELKRPIRDAESIERIIKTADEFTQLMETGMDVSATMILLSDVSVSYTSDNDDAVCGVGGHLVCSMNGRRIDSHIEDDPVWRHAMEFRLSCAKVLLHIGPLWRASLFLSISEELVLAEQQTNGGIEYTIEGDILHETQEERRQGVLERFDTFAAALQQIGLIGIWDEKPIADGDTIVKHILPGLPKGPMFRNVMDEQWSWMMLHPGANMDALTKHLQSVFAPYANDPSPPLVSHKG